MRATLWNRGVVPAVDVHVSRSDLLDAHASTSSGDAAGLVESPTATSSTRGDDRALSA